LRKHDLPSPKKAWWRSPPFPRQSSRAFCSSPLLLEWHKIAVIARGWSESRENPDASMSKNTSVLLSPESVTDVETSMLFHCLAYLDVDFFMVDVFLARTPAAPADPGSRPPPVAVHVLAMWPRVPQLLQVRFPRGLPLSVGRPQNHKSHHRGTVPTLPREQTVV
jgi:hypothetical protein